MNGRNNGRRLCPCPLLKVLAGGTLLLLLCLLVAPGAKAMAEEAGVLGDAYSVDFHTVRDPRSFMEDMASPMPLPKTLVPLTREDAVAWELHRRSSTLSESDALQTASALCEEADALGFDPWLFLALIHVESNYNHLAISYMGAEGLMQLMPSTAAWTAEHYGLSWPDNHSFDPVLNVRLGARYLALLIEQFDGHYMRALTAYNRGPSATRYIVRKYGALPQEIRDFYANKVLLKYTSLHRAFGSLPRAI